MKSVMILLISCLSAVVYSAPVGPGNVRGFHRRDRARQGREPQFQPQAGLGPAVPGLQYQRNPDGSISGSFSASEAINAPGHTGSFGISQTFSFGPQGSSISGSQTASLNGNTPGGNFGFSQSNALSQSHGPNGFSSSGSNAASNNFNNPLFSSSNANANAFSNANQFNNPGFGNFPAFNNNLGGPGFGKRRRGRP